MTDQASTPVRAHASVSPSGAHRWMVCTAAPLYEAQFPRTESPYAEAGTLAHSICELKVRYYFGKVDEESYTAGLAGLKQDPNYASDMEPSSSLYLEYIANKAAEMQLANDGALPFVSVEERVDLSEWLTRGWGFCDCVMISGDLIHIVDYKNGVGEVVSSVNNPQMRLYALGALRKYELVYGDAIKRVSMAIVQPNVSEEVTEDSMTVEELLAWGETVKPIAKKALDGTGEYHPGREQCRFCRGRELCRARAEYLLELEKYKDVPFEGDLSGEEQTAALVSGNGMLLDDEIGDLLTRAEMLSSWYADLKAYALRACLEGRTIDGYKAVAGRSTRVFKDQDKALEILRAHGFDDAVLYDREPKSLAQLEKMIGKKAFSDLLSDQITKPAGAPTLAKASDKRPAIQSKAEADFSDLVSAS